MNNPTAPQSWPLYQQNPQRSGHINTARIASEYQTLFDPLVLDTKPVGAPVIDVDGNILCYDGLAQTTIYAVTPAGQLKWKLKTDQQLTSGGISIGGDGTIYAAGTSLIALTPGTQAQQKFTFPFDAADACAGPLAFSADGGTVYVALKNETEKKGSVVAINLPTSGEPTQAWKASINKKPCSGIALSADGTLYLGTQGGQLFQVSTTGDVTLTTSASGTQLSTPAIGTDGVVHCLSTDPDQETALLFAFNPATPNGTQFTFQPMGRFHKTNPQTGLAISEDGHIHVCFNSLYQLSWSTQGGYSQVWQSNPTTDHGTYPGPPVIDHDGNVVISGSDNWLVSYTSDGSLLWNQQSNSLGAALALTGGGSIVYFNEQTLCATTFGGNPLLNSIHDALMQARTQSGQEFTYPLTAVSLGSEAIFSMVSTALGADQERNITGTLEYDGQELKLSGTGSWLHATEVTVSLTFTASGQIVHLIMSATLGQDFKLSQAIPIVNKSFWERLELPGLIVTQEASTSTPGDGWNAQGNVALSGGLALAASLFIDPPNNVVVTGTISIDGKGYPTVSLVIGHVFSAVFGTSWNLPEVKLILATDSDPKEGLIVSSIMLSTEIEVVSKKVHVYASIPETAGTVMLYADFDPVLNVIDVGNMIFWPNGNTTAFKAALPPAIVGQTGFGLQSIRATIIPSSREVSSVSVYFSASSYTIFSVADNGVSMMLDQVEAFVSVFDPFKSSRTYSVGLSGQIALKASGQTVLTVAAEVAGPDWEISGKAIPGTSVSPVNAIAALGGSQQLPQGSPGDSFGYVSFSAQPSPGIYSVQFIGTSAWTIFQIGSFSAVLSNFSLSVNRIISNPNTDPPTGTITVNLMGQLTIAGASFGLGAYATSDGNWQFYASLGSYIALPTIGQLADALDPGISAGLPTAISDLGSNIVINQLSLVLAIGQGSNSLTLDIGTQPGWEGWTIFSTPFTFSLKDALTQVFLDASATPKARALIQATFELGTAGVRLQVPLPFSSGDFVFQLVQDQQGIAIPTVGDIISLISSDWSSMLPSAITDLGSNIRLTQFEISRKPQEGSSETTITAFSFELGAQNQEEQWSPLGLSGFSLSALGLGGSVSKVSSASNTTVEGHIDGTIHIGSEGLVPLRTTFQNNFDHIILALNGQATLPSIKDIISLFNSDWGNALPDAVTKAGQSLDLTKFQLEKTGTTNTVDVAVGSGPNWAPITIGGASWLVFKSYGFSLHYGSNQSPTWYGSLGLVVTLFEEEFTITASMPELVFQVEHHFSSLNLKTICQTFLNADSVPEWLKDVGLQTVTVTVNFQSPTKISVSTTVGDVSIGFLGSLSNITLSAEFGGGKRTQVCLSGNWNPPGGASVPGTFCYPFSSFKFKDVPDKKIDLPEDPKSEPANSPGPIGSGAPGAIAAVIGAFVAAGAAGAVAAGMLSWIFGENNSSRQKQDGAPKACAGGAINYFNGKGPLSKEELKTILEALKQCFPDSTPQDLTQSLLDGANEESVQLNPLHVAYAVAMVFSDQSHLEIATILHVSYTDADAGTLATYLSAAEFTISDSSPVLLWLFPSSVGTAATMLAALLTGYPSASNPELVTALAVAGFTARACIRLFKDRGAAVNDLAKWLAGTGFAPVESGVGLADFYTTELGTSTEMADVMMTAFQANLTSGELWKVLFLVGYRVAQVLTTMKSKYATKYATLDPLAADALNTGYLPSQISASLLTSFPDTTGQELIEALKAGLSSLTIAQAMLALNRAGEDALEAATAYMAVAKSLWQQTPDAQNLANALQGGEYGAIGVMRAESVHFSSSINKPLTACQLLHAANYTRSSAESGLVFWFGNTREVQEALSTVYG